MCLAAPARRAKASGSTTLLQLKPYLRVIDRDSTHDRRALHDRGERREGLDLRRPSCDGWTAFASNTTLIDMRAVEPRRRFQRESGIIEVESGIEWPELIAYKTTLSATTSGSGASPRSRRRDRLTIGRRSAANIHGRGLRMKTIVGDVESFKLIELQAMLWSAAARRTASAFPWCGGYGLFGVVAQYVFEWSRVARWRGRRGATDRHGHVRIREAHR